MNHKKLLQLVFGWLSVTLLLVGCSGGSTVSGVLVDLNTGQPIGGVGLQLVGVEQKPDGSYQLEIVIGEKNRLATTTDSEGRFVFTSVPLRTYTIIGTDSPPRIGRDRPFIFKVEDKQVELGIVEFQKQ